MADSEADFGPGGSTEVTEGPHSATVIDSQTAEAINFRSLCFQKMSVWEKRSCIWTTAGHAMKLEEGIYRVSLEEDDGIGKMVDIDAKEQVRLL